MHNINLKEVALEQGSKEWLLWRESGIGASDVVTIMGESEYKTKYQLYLEKKGITPPLDLSSNPHVRRGHRCEPIVRDYLSQHFGVNISVFCAYDHNHPHRKVSFDGVGIFNHKDNDGRNLNISVPIEIKAPCVSIFEDILANGLNSKSATYHMWQMQYQIRMCNAPYGYLVFFCDRTQRLKIYKIDACSVTQEKIFNAVDFFWDNLKKGIAPEMDKQRDVFKLSDSDKPRWEGTVNSLIKVNEREALIKGELEKLRAEKKALSKTLLSMAPGFKSINAGGVQITRYATSPRVEYKKLLKNLNVSSSIIELFRAKKGESRYKITILRKK